MDQPIRVAVFLSGNGTTLQNLIDRVADGRLKARIALVASNRADAYGLKRAAQAGIATAVVERKQCANPEEFSRRLFDACREAKVDLVCLAGFMQLVLIPDDFLGR